MCGIIGISKGRSENLLKEGLKTITHRGPDDQGVFVDDYVTLGHQRLSIIDLSVLGHQPMTIDNSTIIFNGEIYNYQELSKELSNSGVQFLGKSDTEVILRGYLKEGQSFLGKLRGMWALAIYDAKKGEIVLSRDHFGIKPLLYCLKGGHLYLASETKALNKICGPFKVNTDKYFQFFNLGYFIGEDTCYEEVKKVLPGEVLTWHLAKKVFTRNFLSLRSPEKIDLSFDEAVVKIEEILLDSVEKHYIADVEVGLLLSGGMDSSLIAAISKKLGKKPVAYHIAIPGSIDTLYARNVARELDLVLIEKEFSIESIQAEYGSMKSWLDQPSSDVSLLPTSLVYKAVNKDSKVVLSGEGGDELFGGYLRHQKLYELKKINPTNDNFNFLYSTSKLGLNFFNPMVRRIQEKINSDVAEAYLHQTKTLGLPLDDNKIKNELLNIYLSHPYKNLTPLNLFFDQFMYLPDSLMYKNDITSMQSSIEARVPIVDRAVLQIAASLPDKFRLSAEYSGKKILKAILRKYLPDNIVERPKKGFGFSFNSFDSKFFIDDYKKAAGFHLKNSREFNIGIKMRDILSESKAEIICRKFPRFAFSLITNRLVMHN